jgi:hypothetical protein
MFDAVCAARVDGQQVAVDLGGTGAFEPVLRQVAVCVIAIPIE